MNGAPVCLSRVEENRQQQEQMRGFFATLRMTIIFGDRKPVIEIYSMASIFGDRKPVIENYSMASVFGDRKPVIESYSMARTPGDRNYSLKATQWHALLPVEATCLVVEAIRRGVWRCSRRGR
jgi:hypothetical protein